MSPPLEYPNKKLSASGGLCLTSQPDQGLCPWTPLGALPQTPERFPSSKFATSLMICTMCQMCQLENVDVCSWSTAYRQAACSNDSSCKFVMVECQTRKVFILTFFTIKLRWININKMMTMVIIRETREQVIDFLVNLILACPRLRCNVSHGMDFYCLQ